MFHFAGSDAQNKAGPYAQCCPAKGWPTLPNAKGPSKPNVVLSRNWQGTAA
ncbi:MAG: hypothetical protein IPF65_06140 [Polaromonas sp.]|nr:hypothetical protein [Polaromonas sp.]